MWKDSYRLGVDQIDTQHRELFRMTAELVSASKGTATEEDCQKALGFLKDYVIRHFRDEEAYQEAILAHDYTRLAYLYQVPWDPEGLLFWSTVEIADSEIITQKIQTDQACYQLKITVEDPGMSQLPKGTSNVWLWCRRIRQGEEIQSPGWTIEGLMSQQPPQSWWQE